MLLDLKFDFLAFENGTWDFDKNWYLGVKSHFLSFFFYDNLFCHAPLPSNHAKTGEFLLAFLKPL